VVQVRVLVTGGTGFVGSHTVAALTAVGHEVRLLVRSADRSEPALAPLGVL
jgi:dihydroflavonol-4-reductase